MVNVAQLVRALDCGSKGRGFESHLSPLFGEVCRNVRCTFFFVHHSHIGSFWLSRFSWLRFLPTHVVKYVLDSVFQFFRACPYVEMCIEAQCTLNTRLSHILNSSNSR